VSSPAATRTARGAELRTGLLAALLALGLSLTACETSDSAAEPREEGPGRVVDVSGTDPVGQERAGSVAPLAMCVDWNGGSEDERLATIAEIRNQLHPEGSSITSPELTDEEALEMFDTACEPSWAEGFRLYKLYARAVGFVELKRAIDE
jgi:hypothetical protein